MGDVADVSFMREILVGAGVWGVLLLLGAVLARRCWRASLNVAPLLAASLSTAALLAWTSSALTRLVLAQQPPTLLLLIVQCSSGRAALALLLFVYFSDEVRADLPARGLL